MVETLGAGDWLTISAYFCLLLGVVVYASRRQKRGGGTGSAAADYFLADNDVKWWAVAASLFASNIGAEHFVGLAGLAAYSGMAVSFYEFGATVCLLILGYLFLPVFFKCNVATMPSWLEDRFSPFCGTALVVISLALYVLTKISATLYAGELLLQEVMKVEGWASVGVLIVGTAAYTVAGGLGAVIYTETLQTVVLFVGGLLLLGFSLAEVGGFEIFMKQSYPDKPYYFEILRPYDDPEFPWTGFFSGYFVTSIWYWCNDQVIVQRALAARTVQHGRAGCVGASYLKLLPGFLMCIPGMIAFSLMVEVSIQAASQSNRLFFDSFSNRIKRS